MPVYHYHGLEDEFVPVAQDVALHQAWCSLGVTDDFQLYPGRPPADRSDRDPNVIKWVEERLAGKKAPSTCGLHSAERDAAVLGSADARDGRPGRTASGWELSGKVTEAKSGISVEVPKGSTLSAEGDVTTGALTANLSIPPIDQTIWSSA